ncbi:chorismate mutase [Candidatus Peregrinibacteria bacterium]|jgi:chorismate mutase|nr:chorismate mutase [Candidatus Peregrinibacteria bacterium]MBT7484618.1 chorismate mutase [Candidatus Peregrinibacteria bacterium]MBT7702650.1 chorismate mutase [Candidatus Peregrinibacteria bacterium]
MTDEINLDDFREKLDQIDDQIVDLLGERFDLISQVKEYKKKHKVETYHPKREQEILERVEIKGKKMGLNTLLLHSLFLQIFAVSKRKQDNKE